MKYLQKKIASLLLIGFLLGASWVSAQNPKDIKAIKDMCGCYKIKFEFSETFAPNKDYKFHDNYTTYAPTEYAMLIEDSKDKIVIQHLLVIGDTMIIKHWRQDWIYQNEDFYMFDHDKKWNYEHKKAKEVAGQWTQKVYQVDDSPRYEGTGSWVHADGKHYWESTTTSPLPRREHTKRKDYNLMIRRNRQEITDFGWVHDQDNDKVIRSANGDKLLAQEKGFNTYTKIPESKCKIAKKWWKEHNAIWGNVRSEWDVIFAQKKNIALKSKVDKKPMWKHMFALKEDEKDKIAPILKKFIIK